MEWLLPGWHLRPFKPRRRVFDEAIMFAYDSIVALFLKR